jgi:hypothetical protein
MGRESPISASSVNFDERPRSFASINVNEVCSSAMLFSSSCWRLKGQFHEMNFVFKVNSATGVLSVWFSKVLISFCIWYLRVAYCKDLLHCKEIWIYVFPEKELRGPSPNFHIHVSVSDLYIPTFGPPIFLQQTDRGNTYMNRSEKHECSRAVPFLVRISGIVSLQ